MKKDLDKPARGPHLVPQAVSVQPHQTIVCDCCGTEPMAELVGARLVIRRMRGQQLHFAVVILTEEPSPDA